jgi:hypothetical protein
MRKTENKIKRKKEKNLTRASLPHFGTFLFWIQRNPEQDSVLTCGPTGSVSVAPHSQVLSR